MRLVLGLMLLKTLNELKNGVESLLSEKPGRFVDSKTPICHK